MSASKVHVLSHPLVNERFAKLRQTSTTPKEFREVRRYQEPPSEGIPSPTSIPQGIHDIALMLGIEASRDLEEQPFQGVSKLSVRVFVH